MTIHERDFTRQDGLVTDDLHNAKITLFGCGAVGRNVACSLASIGADNVTLVDFDNVEASNVTTQGFLDMQIGRSKVRATRESMQHIAPMMSVRVRSVRWTPNDYSFGFDRNSVIISAVDNMRTRSLLHRRCADEKVRLFLDARLQGEALQVYAAYDPETHKAYRETLFTDEEAEPGRCTSQATFYASTLAANALVGQLVRYLRGDFIYPRLGGSVFEFGPLN